MSQDAASAATTQTTISQSTPDTPPPPPNPSKDPQLALVEPKPSPDASDAAAAQHDLSKLRPAEALRLLAASVELLVRLTGDIPPTPPPKTPTDPQMSGITAEKAHIARSHSERSLARLRQQAEAQAGKESAPKRDSQVGVSNVQAYSAAMAAQLMAQQAARSPGGQQQDGIDGVRLKDASPPAQPDNPYMIIGADSQPVNMQHGAITRKFYSKKEPPITVQQYLQRLHQFCPMSTAVYLATSLYIHRLAVDERAIPVTRRNAHRLVLAGLRVAMKALEDLSYPHGKIAKVGGVSEVELARLEISFCFLAGFDLVVREEDLRRHWEALRDGRAQQILTGMEVPTLKLGRRPREIPTPGVES